MGSAVAEIGLDLNLCGMKSVGNFLKDPAGDGRAAKSEESLLRRLEEEKRKIEAFKRELPLCMKLLTHVIERLKEEVEPCQSSRFVHDLEEFLPTTKSKLDDDPGVNLEADCKEKMNWMSSAQLWLDNSSFGINDVYDKKEKKVMEEKSGRSDSRPEESLFVLQSKSRNEGCSRAFFPFKGISDATALPRSKAEEAKPAIAVALPNLSLLTPAAAAPVKCPPVSAVTEDYHVGCAISKGLVRPSASTSAAAASPGVHLSLQAQHQLPRKSRRCWSPELHRRFVLALQQLGGAQVATPKQIRELMKVDGLSNDEVKSHLQKYRLHTRRMPSAANHPLALVGGVWVPPENYSSSSQQSASHSGSPLSPLHLGVSHRSPSNIVGDSCEEEDGKSESYSWM